jgi:tetratricopeptide (TPR) repeat protein
LSQHLKRHAKAAEVYAEMLELAPDSEHVASELFRSLKQAGRYQELLRAYKQRLSHVTEEPTKLSLLRQMASLWEVELKNRPSALEIWREVHTLRPDDEEAAAALARLQNIA